MAPPNELDRAGQVAALRTYKNGERGYLDLYLVASKSMAQARFQVERTVPRSVADDEFHIIVVLDNDSPFGTAALRLVLPLLKSGVLDNYIVGIRTGGILSAGDMHKGLNTIHASDMNVFAPESWAPALGKRAEKETSVRLSRMIEETFDLRLSRAADPAERLARSTGHRSREREGTEGLVVSLLAVLRVGFLSGDDVLHPAMVRHAEEVLTLALGEKWIRTAKNDKDKARARANDAALCKYVRVAALPLSVAVEKVFDDPVKAKADE